MGTLSVAIPMVLNGAIGAKLHIPFSIVVRASFGYYLAYFCIVSRCILSMFWLGVQVRQRNLACLFLLPELLTFKLQTKPFVPWVEI
jgi:NCS1 family nucleobase:cation symporter-1